MQLPTVPPLVLVEPSALESAEVREGRQNTIKEDGAAPVSFPFNPLASNQFRNFHWDASTLERQWLGFECCKSNLFLLGRHSMLVVIFGNNSDIKAK